MKQENEIQALVEQQRLIITLGVIATSVAILALLVSRSSGITWYLIKFTLALSCFFGFMFVLLSASKLKYKEPGAINDFVFPEYLRHKSYDLMIDIFGVNLFLVLGYFISTRLGWDGKDLSLKYLYGLIFAGLLLLVISLMLTWAKQKERK